MARRLTLLLPSVVATTLLLACTGANEATAPPTTVPVTVASSAPATSATAPPAPTTSLPPPMPAPSPPAVASPGNNRVTVLGDSVILGAQIDVPRTLIGWDTQFDAVESRLINHGLDVLKGRVQQAQGLHELDRATTVQAYLDAGREPPPPTPAPTDQEVLGSVVVIHLCTNYLAGGGFELLLDQYMAYLAAFPRVVWVTCGEWSDGQVEANAAIRAAPSRYPNVVVADWARFAPTPGYTYEDGIHLTEQGRASIAELVARAVGPAPTPLPPAPRTTLPPPTTTTTTAPPEPPGPVAPPAPPAPPPAAEPPVAGP